MLCAPQESGLTSVNDAQLNTSFSNVYGAASLQGELLFLFHLRAIMLRGFSGLWLCGVSWVASCCMTAAPSNCRHPVACGVGEP